MTILVLRHQDHTHTPPLSLYLASRGPPQPYPTSEPDRRETGDQPRIPSFKAAAIG